MGEWHSQSKNLYGRYQTFPLYIRWQEVDKSTDIAKNTSKINVEGLMFFQYVGAFNLNGSQPNTFQLQWNGKNIGSKKSFYELTYDNGPYGSGYYAKVYANNISIEHNSDGTAKGHATLVYTHGGQSIGDALAPPSDSVSTNDFALVTIPRASSIETITTSVFANGTDKLSVDIARASETFTHTVSISLGDKTIVNQNVATHTDITIPKEWCRLMPNTISSIATVIIDTFNDKTKLGSASTSVTIKVPEDVIPTMSDATHTRINGPVPAAWGVYVQGISKTKIQINNPQGAYGSTIKSYSIVGPGINSIEQSCESYILSVEGLNKYVCTITDTRGRSCSQELTINVEPYYNPSVKVTAVRCDSSGNAAIDGTYLYIIASYNFSSIGGKNSITSKSVVCNGVTQNTFTSDVGFIFDANISIGNSYTLVASVTDGVGRMSTISAYIPTSYRVMNVKSNEKGIAFGGFSQKDGLEVKMDAYFENGIYVNDATLSDYLVNQTKFQLMVCNECYSKENCINYMTRPNPVNWGPKYFSNWNDIVDKSKVIVIMTSTDGSKFIGIQTMSDKVGKLLQPSGIYWEIPSSISILDSTYPVGSIYMSTNSTSPANLFGGGWESISDTFLYAAGTKTAGTTGGKEEHTLTEEQLPKIDGAIATPVVSGHSVYGVRGKAYATQFDGLSYGIGGQTLYNPKPQYGYGFKFGGGKAHNNMPPYLTVYMWKRIS